MKAPVNYSIHLTWLAVFVWISWGIYLFHSHSDWTLGELGDYFGGGLGGLAIFALFFTANLQRQQLEKQSEQLEDQRIDSQEAGLLRTFNVLRPEAEGLSIRIVSKLKANGCISLSDEEFSDSQNKFRTSDPTVFLRLMKRHDIKSQIMTQALDEEIKESVKRFKELVRPLFNKIEELQKENKLDDFCNALLATELMHTYKCVFDDD